MTSVAQITSLGSIMTIWAHPDDETFVCGGILRQAAINNQQSVCVTATKGELGVQDEHRWPADQLSKIREKELRDALAILGVEYHHWLGYPDGGCDTIEEQEAVRQLQTLVEKYQPDSILTFGPDGLTGHPDHRAVSSWATQLARQNGIDLYYAITTPEMFERFARVDEVIDIFFNIHQPPIVDASDCAINYKLSQDVCRAKCDAFKAMPSQMGTLVNFFGEDGVRKIFKEESFVKAV